MAVAIQLEGGVAPESAVTLLRLARRAVIAALATATAITDVDTDAWQAKAAASHQQSRQHDGCGASHHGLRFHWNTPEFPLDAKGWRLRNSIRRCAPRRQRHLLPIESKLHGN
jgi:hypothetical protein